jgi:hypothetical protein
VSDYAAQLRGVVRAVAFHQPLTYSWLGRRVAPLPAAARAQLPPEAIQAHVRHLLRFQLYRDFYGQGGVSSSRAATPPAPTGGTAFAQRLAAANAGHGSWEPGWRVVALADGTLEAAREGLALRLQAPDYQTTHAALQVGALLDVRLPKDLFNLSPGYYMAVGDALPLAAPAGPLVRLYWNVTPRGAIRLIEVLTPRLNAAGIPFQLKALTNPAAYTRTDAAVLYVPGAAFAEVRDILTESYTALRADLGPLVPALTLPLAPGLGLAEDPAPGESFGLHRCALLAEALLQAYLAGQASEDQRFAAVVTRFAAAGIDLQRPYLNPGSEAVYDLPIPQPTTRPGRPTRPPADDFIEVALAIGRKLDAEAIWHETRCTWVGADPDEAAADGEILFRALGPDLYAGTAGVGLFLIELWRVTGEPWARRTGGAALRQALSRAALIAPAARLGLYTGWAGIALVATRAGRLLGDGELEAGGRALASDCLTGRGADTHDLIMGRAGAILALLLLTTGGAGDWLAAAIELGDELIAAATPSGGGWSWPSPHRGPGLTGLSHGAAGIGYALLELWRATGAPRFRAAAERAYNYERRWFDAARGNWADRRAPAGRDRRARAFATAWCHGAPGIALSRLRAAALLSEGGYLEEAQIALETTRQGIAPALARPRTDFSLCHGLTGLAEVLLAGADSPDLVAAPARALALEVTRTGAARYGGAEQAWPGGVTGATPALLVGLAGIGLFYLRRHDPTTPSPVLPLTLTIPPASG